MTEEDKVRAVNANTLRQDPTFQAAVLEARRSSLEELARIEPTDVEAIRNAQAKIRAIDSIASVLAGFIIAGTPQRKNTAI